MFSCGLWKISVHILIYLTPGWKGCWITMVRCNLQFSHAGVVQISCGITVVEDFLLFQFCVIIWSVSASAEVNISTKHKTRLLVAGNSHIRCFRSCQWPWPSLIVTLIQESKNSVLIFSHYSQLIWMKFSMLFWHVCMYKHIPVLFHSLNQETEYYLLNLRKN